VNYLLVHHPPYTAISLRAKDPAARGLGSTGAPTVSAGHGCARLLFQGRFAGCGWGARDTLSVRSVFALGGREAGIEGFRSTQWMD